MNQDVRSSLAAFSRCPSFSVAAETGGTAGLPAALTDLQAMNDRLSQEVERRRQAEQCLQSHYDFLQTIFDAEPACVQMIAPDGRLQFINQSGLALLEVETVEDLVDNSVEPTILPEWRPAFWAMHQQVCGGEKAYLEFQLQSYGGRVLWMEAYGAPVKDPISGQVMHLSVAQNITGRKQIEQALQNSEHLFSTVANASPAMIWMDSTDHQRIYVNQPWLAFRGRTLEAELGQGWIEGLHPEDRDHSLATMVAAMAARQPYSLEYRLQRQDDQFRWVVDRGQPHYSPEGQYLGYIGTCMDMTEHRQEATLLRLFFDLPFLGMVIYDPRHDTWVRFNQHFCTMLGYSPAEIANLSWEAITHPQDVVSGATHIHRVLSKETEGYVREQRLIHKDGSCVYALVDVKGMRNTKDQVEYLVATIQDITAHRHTTTALRHSEERFRATFEQAAVGIAHVAPDGSWQWVNQTLCDIVGYSREELLELTFQDITHPDDLDADLAYVQDMLAGQRPSYTLEKRYIRKGGSLVWVSLTVSLVRDAQQHPQYFISVIQDISQAKQNQDTLRHYTQRLQGLSTQLLEAQEAERRWLAH